jgi:CRISPR-associated protein Cmr2
MNMNFYKRKLYALLQSPELRDWGSNITCQLRCIEQDLVSLESWWVQAKQAQDIGSSSDRLNLQPQQNRENPAQVTVCHPISGQKQQVNALQVNNQPDISAIQDVTEAKTVFWWFWRFYPELFAATQDDALLFPAHIVLPDCPLHSHQSTVSALTGAMFPEGWKDGDKTETPYLLVFTFSPVQDFIKSSRKFLDFWAGSYLLHYLSTKLCWHIADEFGPDAVIIPSLWSQEIIDALIIKQYPDFAPYFECLQKGGNPVNRFKEKTSTSLSTAGFPNAITVLLPGKKAAQDWGKSLADQLTKEWVEIGEKVRKHIRQQVTHFLNKKTTKLESLIKEVFPEFQETSPEFDLYLKELRSLVDETKHGCWEWRKLWEVQLKNTWEPYWTAIPLGNPDSEQGLAIGKTNGSFNQNWLNIQTEITQPFVNLPNEFETQFYTNLNVGTWWGSIQQRLRLCLNDVKYTRNWKIPAAPGERSTISGQFSAVHPRFKYDGKFCEGAGKAAGSMRLFWYVMSKAYPGLFNGSEKLNALELTKRMAWVYGGVAEALAIPIELTKGEKLSKRIDYEQLIRFPNLSSIGAAAFAKENPELVKTYRDNLYKLFKEHKSKFSRDEKHAFYSKTSRTFHIPNTDKAIKQKFPGLKHGYNGVMFSSKWLIDDMGLQEKKLIITDNDSDSSNSKNNKKQVEIIREIVQQAHKKSDFGDSSPADWWVIVLADGDGMGEYVSGKKLEKYESYVEVDAVDQTHADFDGTLFNQFLDETDKRMGPATHVGLNRALLDFSNRLVPYLTEKRFCGRVIYSGGDDVMVVLPLEDLPEYLLSLRAAWCGGDDPKDEFECDREALLRSTEHNSINSQSNTGYWYPKKELEGIPKRPHFTMGRNATMSAGVIIAHKSVPLPTVLESLWEAESDRAKKITNKDGLCFRVIYGGGNQLEALMKGELLAKWWNWVGKYEEYEENLAPLLYRLAEELPRRASVTENYQLFSKAARVIMDNRDTDKQLGEVFDQIEEWLNDWETWVKKVIDQWAKASLKDWEQATLEDKINAVQQSKSKPVGIEPEDLAKILRFTAFWVDKRVERWKWKKVKS